MEILNLVNMQFLFEVGLILGIFCLFFFASSRKQTNAMYKIDVSLKHFEQMNQQLALLLNEQRRANRLLSEVAGIDLPYGSLDTHPNDPMQGNYGASKVNGIDPAEMSQTKLYVGNIDYAATEAELGAHFARFGQVEFVNIPVNRYTGRARGFGFVTFIAKESAERAISLNGSEFKGRQIQVNFAKERDVIQ